MRLVGCLSSFLGGIIAMFLFVRLGVLDGLFAAQAEPAFDLPTYLLTKLGVIDLTLNSSTVQVEPAYTLPTYLSFVSVMMTMVTVVLAAVAIGIGVIAAYTFREIKIEAKTTAKRVSEQTAGKVAAEALSEVKVKQMVLDIYSKAEKERQAEKEWGEDPDQMVER